MSESTSAPLLPVASPMMPPFEEFVEEIRPLWDNMILTHQGEKYCELEQKMAQLLEVAYAPLFANGHLALQIALRALDLRDCEIITSPYTFASTTQAIVECGCHPVFCDIDPNTFCIDPSQIEDHITENTKAIVGIHVYGMPCDTDAIQTIAQKHNLATIYDGAHAFGVKYKGKGIGSYGDCTMFSFNATKVFNTFEGGALTFNSNEAFYKKICAIRQFGFLGGVHNVPYVGTNGKMTEIQAAMGLCNLRHFEEAVNYRMQIFNTYSDAFADDKSIRTLHFGDTTEANYSYYPIVFDTDGSYSRDTIEEILLKNGYITRKYFYPPTNEFTCIKELQNINRTPVAADIAQRVLCLPLHPNMSVDDAKTISRLTLSSKL